MLVKLHCEILALTVFKLTHKKAAKLATESFFNKNKWMTLIRCIAVIISVLWGKLH